MAANLDVNLIVVTSYTEDIERPDIEVFPGVPDGDGTIWIATYDSNDQFNVGMRSACASNDELLRVNPRHRPRRRCL